MKHLKTPQQLNEASENLNISDVSGSEYQNIPPKDIQNAIWVLVLIMKILIKL